MTSTTSLPLPEDEATYGLILRAFEQRVREVRGTEGLSRPARFEVLLTALPEQLPDPTTIAGTEVVLLVRRRGLVARRIALVVTDALIDVTSPTARELELVLESPHARLRHRVDCRIFRDRTVPEIVTEVLGESRIDVVRRLRGTYPVRPYTVQWEESQLDFVHRLLEEEGIAYLQEDTPEDGERLAVIALVDGHHAWDEPLVVPFVAASRIDRRTDAVVSLRSRARTVAGAVSMRDFTTARPDLLVEGGARVAAAGATPAAIHVYPAAAAEDAVAAQRARRMAEALQADAEGFTGLTDAAAIAPGRPLTVLDVPHLGDEDGALRAIVTGVTHDHRDRSVAGSASTLSFDALSASAAPFRPARVTPKPLAHGFQEGLVVGPPGEDIHTDAMGRVKVHLFWDRYLPHDDVASDWVPVLQDNTGQSAGIPRVGWEVLVGFVDGDPDRPVVVGRLYNGSDTFPEPLPIGKTRTAIRSLSSPTRDGENAIVLEDAAGQEMIKVRVERDREIRIANDKRETVRDTDAEIVVLDQDVRIGKDRTTTVAEAVLRYVSGSETLRVGRSRAQKVGLGLGEVVEGGSSLEVGSTHVRTIGGVDQVTSKSSLAETVGGVVVEASLKDNQTVAEAIETLTVGGAVVELAGKDKVEQANRLRAETIGGTVATTALATYSLKVTGARTTTTARLDVEAAQSAALGPPPPSEIGVGATETLAFTVAETAKLVAGKKEIVIQVKDSVVSLSAAGLSITSKRVEILADGEAAIAGPKAAENESR